MMVPIDTVLYNMAKKYLLTVTDEMGTKLEKEMKRRMIETVPETVRVYTVRVSHR